MRWWLLGCLMACHARSLDIPVATINDASPVSTIDAGEERNEDVVDAAPSPQRILLIGDSQVRYLSWYFDRAEVKQPNETVLFDSHPGYTILAMNRIFVAEMNKYPNLDEVIIFLGTNNFNFNFIQDHQNILDEIKRRHIKCVWAGPTDVRMKGFKNLHIIGPLIKHSVEEVCTYFDTEAFNISLLDGIHPDLEGGKKWLREIWKIK